MCLPLRRPGWASQRPATAGPTVYPLPVLRVAQVRSSGRTRAARRGRIGSARCQLGRHAPGCGLHAPQPTGAHAMGIRSGRCAPARLTAAATRSLSDSGPAAAVSTPRTSTARSASSPRVRSLIYGCASSASCWAPVNGLSARRRVTFSGCPSGTSSGRSGIGRLVTSTCAWAPTRAGSRLATLGDPGGRRSSSSPSTTSSRCRPLCTPGSGLLPQRVVLVHVRVRRVHVAQVGQLRHHRRQEPAAGSRLMLAGTRSSTPRRPRLAGRP